MRSRLLWWHTALALLLCQAIGVASSEVPLVEGRDFSRAPAQAAVLSRAPASTDVVEVLEFFSYGCGACYAFHPLGSRWSAELPSNTTFTRVPTALGRRDWEPLVRMYYALQATGHLERLHQALFDAIHRERLELFDEEALIAWVARQGVDGETFRTAFHSQAVSQHVSWAGQMDKAYAVPSTPALVIDGKYLVEGAHTVEEQLRTAGRLLDQARATKQRPPGQNPERPLEKTHPKSETP